MSKKSNRLTSPPRSAPDDVVVEVDDDADAVRHRVHDLDLDDGSDVQSRDNQVVPRRVETTTEAILGQQHLGRNLVGRVERRLTGALVEPEPVEQILDHVDPSWSCLRRSGRSRA
jgi:hypothetical protein